MRTKLKWTWSGRIKLAIGVLFLLGALESFREAWECDQRFETVKRDKPVQGGIDLSQPGEFSYPMHLAYQTSHGLAFMVQVPPDVVAKPEADEMAFLHGLDLEVVITDAQGQEVLRGAPDELWPPMRLHDEWMPAMTLFETWHLSKGHYIVKIVIMKGVPALQGVSQQLVGRYRQCGCERAAVYMGNLFGGLFLMLGLWGIAEAFRGLKRDACLEPPDPPPPPVDALVERSV